MLPTVAVTAGAALYRAGSPGQIQPLSIFAWGGRVFRRTVEVVHLNSDRLQRDASRSLATSLATHAECVTRALLCPNSIPGSLQDDF
jgi:hypothetical protein